MCTREAGSAIIKLLVILSRLQAESEVYSTSFIQEVSLIMARRREEKDIDKLLGLLQDIDDEVHDKKQTLNEFLEELSVELKDSGCSLFEKAHFLYVGSSYEGTVVHDRTDFDIPLILSRPFMADNFELIERHEPGFYKLRPYDDDDSDESDEDEAKYEEWSNKNDFLRIEDMKDYIFTELSQILERIKTMNSHWSLKYSKMISTVRVMIKDTDGDTIKIDIVPAFRGFDFEHIPGGRQKSELPAPLQSRGQCNYYLILAAAPHLMDENDYHLLVSVAFGELEKACLKDSVAVLNAVRLVKLVSDAMGWKAKFGFRSFHIKRVAIKYFADLDGMSDWEAYKRLMGYLSDELKKGEIDGFFLCNQNIYNKDEETAKELGKAINSARRSIKQHRLPAFIKK